MCEYRLWPVKSSDPRKKKIMAALKAKSGANKVTCVYEIERNNGTFFQGDCLKGNRYGYTILGTFEVTAEEAKL